MSDPLTWVLGYAGKKSLDWLLSASAKEDLQERLRQTVTDWSKSLPSEISVFPDALFPDNIDAKMANDPAVLQVARRLSENRLPSTEEWAGLIDARRRFVCSSAPTSQLQPFFQAADEKVRPATLDLATRIDRECRQDTKLFRGESLAILQEIQQSLEKLKRAGPSRPLQWAEQHVLMTLGLTSDSSSADREKAKQLKLQDFNQSLLDVLSGSESFAQLLVRHSQALGIPTASALDLWIRDSLLLPYDVADARASIAIVGWRFETSDPRVSFSAPDAKIIEAAHYTEDLVSFLHSLFPNVPVTVACLDSGRGSISEFSEFDAVFALQAAIEQKVAPILVIPFQLHGDKDTERARVYVNMTELGFVPVLPLSFAHGTRKASDQERLAVLASPLSAVHAVEEGDVVLCFPIARFLKENDGSAKVVSNDSLACLVAAGMASLLLSQHPKSTSAEIIKAIHDSRAKLAHPIPSYEKASKLLTK